MRIAGKDISDECINCGNMLQCKLFVQGHGIRCERTNITEMIKCQIEHKEGRRKK